MLGISKKPGPPVPPRPSAAAVATALAKQRENSPSPNGGTRGNSGNGMVGMATLKPPHPGRTVVYKSPDFDQPQARNRSHLSSFGGSVPEQLQGSPNPSTKRNAIYHDSPGQSPRAMERKLLTPAGGGVMYRSTCSIVEINTSPSTSGSSSVSTSPVATLQKHSADQMSSKLQKDSLTMAPIARRRVRTGDSHSSEGSPETSEVIIVNGGTHGSSISLLSTPLSLDDTENGRGKSLSECDSGTERGDSSGSSASAGSTLERENNAKNLESSAKSSHFTEIIIGSNQTSTVVRSGSKPNIATGNSVIRSNSIRLPIKAAVAATATPPPMHHRPEPEGGEHVHPSSDHRAAAGTTGAGVTKSQSTTTLDPATLDSKLSEKKFAFHELLISELTAMRQKQKEQDHQDRQMVNQVHQEAKLKKDESAIGVDLAKINRRQRCPSERRSSGSETETTPNGTATRLPKIRTADWIEVGDNGKQVVLSSCQISLEDSGMEDEEKLDDASSGVGDSWDSVKEDAEERIIMSLPGLPPLPKSLSGFDLAGAQFQSHHQHHHQHPSQHNPHYPPTHHHHQQSTTQSSHHHQMQPQSFHGTPPHPSSLPPSSQSPAAVLNHHHTNPFIPVGSGLLHGDSLASLESQQRGHSPVSSTLSGGSSGGRKTSPQPPGSGPASTSTLDTQLAILRREMYGLRQLDLSLLSQLWALNESIQEFRTMLQEQETLSPPSPTPSNSDANSVSSDDDLDEDDSSTTNNSNRLLHQQQQQHLLLSAHHQLQSSTNSIGGAGPGSGGNLTPGGGPNQNESGGSSTTTLSSSASSRMRAPPPPPPNRKAPSRPV
ncbi:lateral signaling target protein 2 homolog [Anopheles moucheti]|uniref:lateral signaling target protein 2 homolog n=1 Tax=Anopheles moucheti TaxID=186751 RepID=UPI0022F0358E|nr:lateral signaling target protein 2 homolog [Anopheles moucheti]XP_052896946.1 lateral signaling target protein 2 homolog [Anopheles moucheti]